MYRPAHTKVFDTVLSPRLTFPEWVAVTGGQPWSSASQFDRHNLLAAELGLRLLEYADVGDRAGGEAVRRSSCWPGPGWARRCRTPTTGPPT